MWRSSTGTWMAAKKRATMPSYSFFLDDDQTLIWERYAQLKGCSLEHLIQVMIPDMTGHFLIQLANPEIGDEIEEAVLRVLPKETQEILLRRRHRLNEKLREGLPGA